MSNKGELAKRYFQDGYSCAQAVLLAFCEETGLTETEAAKLMSSFGGGLSGLREVCGAVSAMAAVVGMVAGYDDPADRDAKAQQYAKVRALAHAFEEKNGSYICRELLKGQAAQRDAAPAARTPQYYAERPCSKYVFDAAELTEAYLIEQNAAENPTR